MGAIKAAPFFCFNSWSDLAGDEREAWGDGGRRGEVAHGGRARGEMGGGRQQKWHQRAVWEQQKMHWFKMIWLVTRGGDGGRRGEVAHGGRARGETGGGTREQCGATKTGFSSLKTLAGDEGGGMGGGVGRWPMEGGQGGRWGGHQRAVWEQQKVHFFFFFFFFFRVLP